MPRLLPLAFALFIPALAGCGGGDTAGTGVLGGEDERKIANLISEFNEVKGNQAKLKVLFADPPARPKDYEKREFTIPLGGVKVTGDTATAAVEVRQDDATLLGSREWTFAKAGGQWKIKSAPLP